MMADGYGADQDRIGNTPASAAQKRTSWSERYGERHRWQRLTDFPAGLQSPTKVRLYRRGAHYLLQWWEPAAKRNLTERIDGDLLAALLRARQVEDRLVHFRSSGQTRQQRLDHVDMVDRYLDDLKRRADAGAIDPATVRRYAAALSHYRVFSEQPTVRKAWPQAAKVNRDFRLAFTAFLRDRSVAPNGHAHGTARPMKGQRYVLEAVRTLFAWAADPDRGNLLPEGFRNPFLRLEGSRNLLQGDPLADPDITLAMAIELVRTCDRFQLRLFVPLLVFGLRAAEPCFLFREYLDADWLRVPCNRDLDYETKGHRSKRFPLVAALQSFWEELRRGGGQGLLYERRAVVEGQERAPRRGAVLADLVLEYRRRCEAGRSLDAAGRERLRDQLVREAGGLTFDHIEAEFKRLAGSLGWPACATLKDLRHLFATTLGNSAMPEGYRRYLMGQAPGRAAIVAYTHLNDLKRHYAEAIQQEWQPLIEAINRRMTECGAA